MGQPMPYKLFGSVRMLPLAESREFLFADCTGQSVLCGQTSLPFTLNSIVSGPIALLFRGEFLLVIALRLSCRKWLSRRPPETSTMRPTRCIDISASTIGGLNGPELIVKENLDYCISGASRTN